MLTDEERESVRLGALAKELKAHAGWVAYTKAVEDLRRVYLPQAMKRGDSDFEKGAVYAIDLVLTCLDATIERRDELIERERATPDEETSDVDAG